jgi:hypothetical protein
VRKKSNKHAEKSGVRFRSLEMRSETCLLCLFILPCHPLSNREFSRLLLPRIEEGSQAASASSLQISLKPHSLSMVLYTLLILASLSKRCTTQDSESNHFSFLPLAKPAPNRELVVLVELAQESASDFIQKQLFIRNSKKTHILKFCDLT